MTASAMINIVDDDVSFRTAVGDLLSASGYRVSLYESAQEFLKNATADEPACGLLRCRNIAIPGYEHDWPFLLDLDDPAIGGRSGRPFAPPAGRGNGHARSESHRRICA